MEGRRDVFTLEMGNPPKHVYQKRPIRIQWPTLSAVRPIFYVVRIFGLAPYEIVENHIIFGKCNMPYSIFCALLYSYMMYVITVRFKGVRRDNPMLDYTEMGKAAFNYCVAMFDILMTVRNRRKFLTVVKDIQRFDKRILELGYPRSEALTKFCSWTLLSLSAILWIMVNGSGMYAFHEHWTYNTGYMIIYVASSISLVKFSGVVLLLSQRFSSLNEIASLGGFVPAKQKYVIDSKVIQGLQNSLMNAGESLEAQYSWSILLWLANLCMHSVSNLYFLIDCLMIDPVMHNAIKWPLVFCLAAWLVVFLGQLILLHTACHFASTEAKRTGSLLINWTYSRAPRNIAPESSLHLINRRLNFSAAGCFYVNLPLLRSIAALLTTYLVVLLQLPNSKK